MKKGFMYLIAIIDVYIGFLVKWEQICSLEAVDRFGDLEIISSDHGSLLTSEW